MFASSLEAFYCITWVLLLLVALVFLFTRPDDFEIMHAAYWKFLFEPWRVCMFLLAAGGMVAVAPYTGDPTWDTWDGLLTSVLAYTMPPWAVGVIHRSLSRREYSRRLFVACVLFCTPIWAYDAYILTRDGNYPLAWDWNILASGVFCVCAGLFWNLSWEEGRGVVLAFRQETYPPAGRTPFGKVWPYCLALGLPVALSVVWFVATYLHK